MFLFIDSKTLYITLWICDSDISLIVSSWI